MVKAPPSPYLCLDGDGREGFGNLGRFLYDGGGGVGGGRFRGVGRGRHASEESADEAFHLLRAFGRHFLHLRRDDFDASVGGFVDTCEGMVEGRRR